MIDKRNVGNYLRKIRLSMKKENGKSFTQEDIANAISREKRKEDPNANDIYSNVVCDWEKGEALPDFEKLGILSKIYKKTINEILEGEDSLNISDFQNKYFIYNPNWGVKYINDKEFNLFTNRNKQEILVINRFKELLNIRIKNDFTFNEEKEFKFLFENFYHLSAYANKYLKNNYNDYQKIHEIIEKLLIETRNMSNEDKYWELIKMFSENDNLIFKFNNVADIVKEGVVKDRFSNLDNWQKDMYLAMYQNIEPCHKGDYFSGNNLKKYEQQNGVYNKKATIRAEMKSLIENGACLCTMFLNKKKKVKVEYKIIDRLEYLYNLCLKPIEITKSNTDGTIDFYKIENNFKNRFLNSYCITLTGHINYFKLPLNSINSIFEWFKDIKIPFSDELYFQIAKNLQIDISMDKKYWLKEVKIYTSQFENDVINFKNKEKEILSGLDEIEKLSKHLLDGQTTYTLIDYEEIGGYDETSIREYIENQKSNIPLNEYLNNRNKILTKKLYEDLNILSLDQIRNKYFTVEVIENE